MQVKDKEMGSQGTLWNKYLIWLIMIQTFTALAYYGYVPLIPFMESEFSLSNTQVGWMTSSVFLGASIIAIPSGLITDKFGTKKSLFAFCFFLATVTALFYLTTSFVYILTLLFLLGCGYGGITPGTNKGIMEHFELSNRGTAMGLKQTGVSLGSILGTLALPLIATYIGWRSSLLVLSLLLFILCTFHFKILEESNIEYRKTGLIKGLLEVVKNKNMLKIIIIIVFFIWVQLSVMTYLVLYLLDTTNKTTVYALLCLALLQLGGAVGRSIWGAISDRYFSRKRGGILGIIGIVSGILLLIFTMITDNMFFPIIAGVSFLLGVTTQGWNGIFVLLVSEVVRKEQIGLASGVGLASVYIGAVIGTPISGWIIDRTGNYEVMWLICSFFMFLIGILIFWMKLDGNTKNLTI
ncbi:MFS transporter [Lentibacillus jeotgali]|uniref:MFS transporter n=1 Tax=Lentibacillus jeotgali TaxID=558169 RepID=UPI00026283F6|nr:MFS transporter [Lentibacillus jeotgali]